MPETFDFIVVGAGSAGAVIAARLSEDPNCRVALLEAGGRPPVEESIPAACPLLQQNPATDWMYTADAGQCGLGLKEGRMMMPRGKMLGGSSGINYMAYVRGHPGDFDAWADGGAVGWSFRDVLPYFKKSEGLTPSDDITIDRDAHNTHGPLGVSVRSPILSGTPPWRAGFPAAITTGELAVVRAASCPCSRPRPARASGRVPTTRFSRAKPNSDRTSRSSPTRRPRAWSWKVRQDRRSPPASSTGRPTEKNVASSLPRKSS